ncbi:MAG: ABC transporter substrate-binding protein [Clostridia bacterium]|nr:ABC transporter substrate-binding protein [Clostridia bacterium]
MKTFKKIISAVIAISMLAVMCVSVASCGKKTKYTIGIVQLAPHVALDAATEGFKQALIDKLGEENVTFDYQNATGDSTVCTTIVNSFVSKNVDLIMANATAALQAAAAATTTIPVLGTSITEYGVALGLKNFNGTVGGNISGTSDLAPLSDQGQMIVDLFPSAKKIGLLYCSGEPNSAYQVKVIKEFLESKGLTATYFSFSDSNDLRSVTEAAAAASDLIYVPTDNTAANSTEIINAISRERKVPVLTGEEGICAGCGTYTLSISYYELGYKTGEMAAKILTGESKISEMPIEYDPNPVKKYNKDNIEFFGLEVPEGYVAIEK